MVINYFVFVLNIFILSTKCSIEQREWTGEIDGTNVTRTYEISIPSSGSVLTNILFFFTDTPNSDVSQPNYGWDEISEANDFIVVYPHVNEEISCKDVTVFSIKIFSCYDDTFKLWDVANIMNGITIPPYNGLSRCDSQDLTYLEGILSDLSKSYNFTNIWVGGHGYGGFFAYYASQCLEKITGFFTYAGGLLEMKIRIPFVTWSPPWFRIYWPVRPSSAHNLNGLIIHDESDTRIEIEMSNSLWNVMNTFTESNLTYLKLNGDGNSTGNLSSAHVYDTAFNTNLYKFLNGESYNFTVFENFESFETEYTNVGYVFKFKDALELSLIGAVVIIVLLVLICIFSWVIACFCCCRSGKRRRESSGSCCSCPCRRRDYDDYSDGLDDDDSVEMDEPITSEEEEY